MSKSAGKKRSGMRTVRPAQKKEMSERNKKLVQELSLDEGYIDRFTRIFSRWRMITYFWIIFLPPYGLYRVWSKESTFQKSEKWVWTMMLVVYMVYFAVNLIRAA